MASRPARTPTQDLSRISCHSPGQYSLVKDFSRRSEGLRRQQDLTSDSPLQDAPRVLRKRGTDDGIELDRPHVKRARWTADGLQSAQEHTALSTSESHAGSSSYGGRIRQRTVDSVEHTLDAAPRTRRRTSLSNPVADAAPDTFLLDQVEADEAEDDWHDPVRLWIREGRWPQEYFKSCPDMDFWLARKKSSPSLSRKRTNSASTATPSDQKPREEQSAPYRDPRYELLLNTKGVILGKSDLGITTESRELCKNLLGKVQPVPDDTLFRDDLFEATCDMLQGRNEAKVLQDITRLIVPSAQSSAIRGASHLTSVIESVNEGWNNSIPLIGARPQPDYSVGFKRKAFSDDQLDKLNPFIGNWISGDLSFFMATYYMYFPFLACEVKCGAAALDVADRQNAHSMSIAARAVVELFRLVKREAEINRQVLSFSISHDHCSVRIYGYYPVIEGSDTKYYRHPIYSFDFTTLDGKDKWTAFRFTKNIYDLWVPSHLERIRSAIDQLPSGLDFGVDPLPETGLAQESEAQSTAASSRGEPLFAQQAFATLESSIRGAGAAKRLKKDGVAE